VLHLDGAAHGVDDAPKLDDGAIACAFDDAAVVHGDGRIDQVAPQRSEPRQNSILIRAGKPREPDYVGHQNRSKFPGFAHGAPYVRPMCDED
jgi:hypothetical protein